MNEKNMSDTLRHAVQTRLSGLKADPELTQRVMNRAYEQQRRAGKRLSIGMAVAAALLLVTAAALGFALFQAHEVRMFEQVTFHELLPEQWQQYDILHKMSDGYLLGGFQLADDYIAPMEAEDQIVYLDEHFSIVWSLRDARLEGCLFDRVEETAEAFYLGTERKGAQWQPAIMKISRRGEILWLYEGRPQDTIKDYVVTQEGGVCCAGSADGKASLLKIESDGRLAWANSFDGRALTALEPMPGRKNEMIAAAVNGTQVAFLLLDEEGNVLSRASYDADSEIKAARLQPLKDERLLLVIEVFPDESDPDVTSELKYMLLTPQTFAR